ARAGIFFAMRSSHSDGSCDDYYPNERALGATAFSFLACVEACRIIGFEEPEIREFLARRADWLAQHNESGRLSNHHALIALGLTSIGNWLEIDKFTNARDQRLAKLLDWQTSEGWFPEYEGFDPGYDTLTLFCLAELQRISPNDRVEKTIRSS